MTTNVTFYRGNDIGWVTTFKDATGAVATPASANLYLTYKISGVTTQQTIAMTIVAGAASAVWPSGPADADFVDWCVKTGSSPNVVDQGQFLLTKNRANPGT
jgi:hypothetical protein